MYSSVLVRRGSRAAVNFKAHVRPFSVSHAPASAVPLSARVYRYAIDVHGQLFLYDTKPKNLTSCFKNPEFLNFFMARIRFNEAPPTPKQSTTLEQDWTERRELKLDDALAFGRMQGYHWLSPCQGEHNLIRAADSPIVFRELSEDGTLTWAGSFTVPFQPNNLRVDAETGYLYHPSPTPPLASLRKRDKHPYGAYSLLSSGLVLQRLADGLEIDPEQHGKAGSIQWQDAKYDLSLLQHDDVARNRRCRVDDLAAVES